MGIKRALELLNARRFQGIDNYGQGRNPWYMEFASVVVLTDGGRGFEDKEKGTQVLKHGDSPGAELTHESYRWDQRVVSFVLKIAGLNTAGGEAAQRQNSLPSLCTVGVLGTQCEAHTDGCLCRAGGKGGRRVS